MTKSFFASASLFAICLSGCGSPAEVAHPPAIDWIEQSEETLQYMRKIAACTDRVEVVALIRVGGEVRRVGPVVLNDAELLAVIRKTLADASGAEQNPLPHTIPMSGLAGGTELTLVCSSGFTTERMRILTSETIALQSNERIRVRCHAYDITQVLERLLRDSDYIVWTD
jgi:hypothetical protein